MADLVLTTVTLFWMFIGAIAVGGFSFILLMILALFTPAMPFLRAKIRKVPLLAVFRPDRKIDYTPVDKFIPPLALHKEYGGYIVDTESVASAMKGGVSILPVNAEIGVTLRTQILGIIDALKRANIDNVSEAEWLSDRWGRCNICGYSGFMERQDNGTLLCPYYKEEVDVDVKKEEAPLYVSAADRRQRGKKDAAPASEEPERDGTDAAGAVSTGEDV